MAGADPFEIYNVGPLRIPRYKLALYVIFGYVGVTTAVIQYKKRQPPTPIKFDGPEEEDYVKRYIKHMSAEAKKPELLRRPF
ncbi:hypothetical protein BDK51DRAFT_11111, partial [Blyttiomyces helicus]